MNLNVYLLAITLLLCAALTTCKEHKRSFKITDSERGMRKLVVAETLTQLKKAGKEKLDIHRLTTVKVVFVNDGTEVDDESGFQSLGDKEALMLLSEDEKWTPAYDSNTRSFEYREYGGRDERGDEEREREHYHSHYNRGYSNENWKKGSHSKSNLMCVAGPLGVGFAAMSLGPAGWPIAAKLFMSAAAGGATWYLQGCSPEE